MRGVCEALAGCGVVTLALEELAETVSDAGPCSIEGSGSLTAFRCDTPSAQTIKVNLAGIFELDAADQVVEVWAGTTFTELQQELAKHGQCLPFAGFSLRPFTSLEGVAGTVGGQLSMNLPHAFEADCGTWRDWVLGMTVVLADGRVAKSGSRVVKNVTGYDVHRFFVGARGALGVVARVALRIFPLKALPNLDLLPNPGYREKGFIQRTLPADFEAAMASCQELGGANPKTNTLYSLGSSPPKRFRGDWIIGWGQGKTNLPPATGPSAGYLQKAKQIFNPDGKLNRDAFPTA